jgi:hypothetical protein
MTRAFEKLVGLLCLIVLGFALWCTVTHSALILNRYRDSWWHIAAADEYQRTGVFGKDPFYKQAPPFVLFGLMDAANAKLSALTGWPPRITFLRLYSLNTLILLGAAFLTGYRLFRNPVAGLVSSAGVSIFCLTEWPFGSGFQFVTAVSLLGLFCVNLWSRPSRASHTTPSPVGHTTDDAVTVPPRGFCLRALWNGIFLGIIFDLQVFVGLVGVLIVVLTAVVDSLGCLLRKDRQRFRASLATYALMAVGFLAVAWPWLWLQWRALPYLDNPHKLLHMAQRSRYLTAMLIGDVLLAAHLIWRRQCRQTHPLPTPFLWLAAVLLVLSTPVGLWMIGRVSAPFLADRIPQLFPFGVVVAALYMQCRELVGANRRTLAAGVGLLALIALAVTPVTYGRCRFCVGMLRRARTEYRQHPYAFLVDDLGTGWHDKVILSDPYTSFFARGFIGSYAVGTVMWQSSSAVDDLAKYEVARRALLHGPSQLNGLPVDAVVVEKDSHAFLQDDPFTHMFADISANQVVEVWTNQGWRVARETANLFLLCPASNSLPTGRDQP